MEFICSKCGRKDWVFNADAPLCFHCGGPLIGATESYEGRMMSPDFVLHRMTGVVDKHGSVKAGTGRFKREREACATALYALALSESTGKRFWVEVETIDQTPDTRASRSTRVSVETFFEGRMLKSWTGWRASMTRWT